MTRTLSQQELLDALRTTDESATLLEYALWTDPFPLTVGAESTLTLTVSSRNKQKVTCTKIVVTIPVGTNAKDLAASSDIRWERVEGWDVVASGGMFTLMPQGGTTTFADHGVDLLFTNIVVNDQTGTAALTIREWTAVEGETPAERKGTILVPKFPEQFHVGPLEVQPKSIAAGDTAQLMWSGSAHATYVLAYNGGNGYREYDVGNIGPFRAQNLTLSPHVFFTLKVTYVPPGEKTPLELKRTAHIDVAPAKPVITSFTGTMAGERQARLSWATTNADSCRLSGSALQFLPTATTVLDVDRTRYTLVAHNVAGLDSDPSSLLVTWKAIASAAIVRHANEDSRIFVSSDGASLIVATSQSLANPNQNPGMAVHLLDSASLTGRVLYGDGNNNPVAFPAFSKDGKRILYGYRGWEGDMLTIRLAPEFPSGPAFNIISVIAHGRSVWSAFSPDGSRVYVTSGGNRLWVRSSTDFSAIGPDWIVTPVWAGPMEASPDGTKLYIAGEDRVAVIDTQTFGTLASIPMPPFRRAHCVTLDAQRNRLYITGEDEMMVAIDAGGSAHAGTAKISGFPCHAAIAPGGEELFVARQNADAIAIIDAISMTMMAEVTVGEPTVSVAFSPNGARLYALTSSGKVLTMIRSAVT